MKLFSFFFQHLTRKKDKSELAVKSWKVQSHQNVLITKTLDCLSNKTSEQSKEEKKKVHEVKKAESERAQALALEIAAHIDSMGCNTPKPPTG